MGLWRTVGKKSRLNQARLGVPYGRVWTNQWMGYLELGASLSGQAARNPSRWW
jgi:hypothetical protein